jgi:hypothetical protein
VGMAKAVHPQTQVKLGCVTLLDSNGSRGDRGRGIKVNA